MICICICILVNTKIGTKTMSPTLAGEFFTLEPPEKPHFYLSIYLYNDKVWRDVCEYVSSSKIDEVRCFTRSLRKERKEKRKT